MTHFQPLLPKPTARVIVSFCLCLLVGAAFLLRYAAYDAPIGYEGGDGSRDYLIATHAVLYGEWPIAGPPVGTLSDAANSPLYFYALIALEEISTSLWFVNLCYILLSCATIVGVFAITRRLFGSGAAFIAAGLVAFSPIYIQEAAQFVWQARVMEPILVFGVYLLVRGYQSASLYFLAGSVVAVMSALAVFLAVFPLAPFYVLLACILSYRIHKRRGILVILGTTAAALGVLYAPAAFAYVSREGVTHLFSARHVRGISQPFEARVEQTVRLLFVRFFPVPLQTSVLAVLGGLYALGFVAYTHVRHISQERKVVLGLFTLAILIQSVAVIFLKLDGNSRYLMPVYFLVPIVVGTLVYELLLRSKYMQFAGYSLLLVTAVVFLTTPRSTSAFQNIGTYDRPREAVLAEAAERVAEQVHLLRERGGYTDYSFFDIVGYRTGGYAVESAVLYVPLENILGTALVHVDPYQNVRGYTRESTGVYLFVFCTPTSVDSPPYTAEDCAKTLLVERPDMRQSEVIYNAPQLVVLLARHT